MAQAPDKPPRPVVQRVLDIAKDEGITQRELAALLQVTQSTVWHWTKGRGGPDGDQLAVFCHALGVSPHYVLLGQGAPRASQRDVGRIEILTGIEKRVREMDQWLREQRGLLGSPATDRRGSKTLDGDEAARREIESIERDIPFVTDSGPKAVKPTAKGKSAAKKKSRGRKSA